MSLSDLRAKIFSAHTSPSKTHRVINICGLKLKFRCDSNRQAYNRLIRNIRKKSALIVETNNCHYETIPGFAKYFTELGYVVDVVSYESEQLNFLQDTLKTVRIYEIGKKDMECLLKNPAICQYRYILFNSAIKYVSKTGVNSPEAPFVTDYYKDIAADVSKIIFVQHHMERQKINRYQIALADLKSPYSAHYYMVNPHYFGNIAITPKNKKITNFIVVGEISSLRKNHDILLKAVDELAKTSALFKITVVGSGNTLQLDPTIAPYFDMRGRLSYQEMFAAMEEADFFLCLLDPENPDHERYILKGTSGSFQLIYGFAKPCLIQEKFAVAYKFDHTNSLVYKHNQDLATTMQHAIAMTDSEYDCMQSKLKEKAEIIQKRSLNNFRCILNSIDTAKWFGD